MVKYLTCTGLLLGCGLVSGAPKPVKGLIEQWLETEDVIETEALQWKQSKEHLKVKMTVYEKELILLNEELAATGDETKEVDSKVQELTAAVEASQNARKKTIGYVSKIKPRFLALVKKYPAPVVKKLQSEIESLKLEVSNETVRDVLSAMIKILQEGAKFNRAFAFEEQSIKLGNEKLRAKVMYFGLSCAFFRAGEKSGIGRPAADGWVFVQKDEVREAVDKAFAINVGQEVSSFLKLPLKVEEVQP